MLLFLMAVVFLSHFAPEASAASHQEYVSFNPYLGDARTNPFASSRGLSRYQYPSYYSTPLPGLETSSYSYSFPSPNYEQLYHTSPAMQGSGYYDFYKPDRYFYEGALDNYYTSGYSNLRRDPPNKYSNRRYEIASPKFDKDSDSDVSLNNEQPFKISYLGLAPTGAFETDRSDTYSKEAPSQQKFEGKIPFYSIDNTDVGGSQNNGLPSVMISPYRFKTDLPSFSPEGSYKPIVFDSTASIRPVISNTGTGRPPLTPQFSKPYQPYTPPNERKSLRAKSSPSLRNDGKNISPTVNSRRTSSSAQNSYLLIDFEPLDSNPDNSMQNSGYYSYSDPALGLSPLIPLLSTSSKSYMRTGFEDNNQQSNQYEHQNFDTGYNSRTLNGHAFSNLHTDKGVEVTGFNQQTNHAASTGVTTKYIHPSEEVGKLVRRLIMYRNRNRQIVPGVYTSSSLIYK